MTAAWRISLDSGMYANFPSFLLDKLAGRQPTNQIRLAPGEAQLVETGGRPIKDVVADLPFNDVTPGLMQMMDKITEQAKAAGGAPDIPVGEGVQNIPVGTMLAHIEQATKVMAAAHKGQHRAMDEELSLIADLFRENPEAFWKGNKQAKGFWDVQKLLQALNERSLVPKSDPNIPSHIHRVMKAVALVELKSSPLGARLDDDEVLRRVLAAMHEDPVGLVLPKTPQGPSPDMIKAEADLKKAEAALGKNEVDKAEIAMKPQVEQMKADATVKGKTIELAKTLITHDGDREDAARQHDIDKAQLARGANQDALQATKIATDAMKTRQEGELKQREHGLAAAQAMHSMGLERSQHALEQQQTRHQMAKETADLGLAGAEFGHKREMEGRDRDLAERELTAKVATDQDKIGTERAKVGVAQQQADTARHVALHPPKPVGGAKKPKGRK
jgi:hypothetical protein